MHTSFRQSDLPTPPVAILWADSARVGRRERQHLEEHRVERTVEQKPRTITSVFNDQDMAVVDKAAARDVLCLPWKIWAWQ